MSLPMRRLISGLAALLMTLALAMQLSAAGLQLPQLAGQGLAAEFASAICHADPSSSRTPTQDHAPDCALCPLCLVASHGQALLTPTGPWLTAPLLRMARVVFVPKAGLGWRGLTPLGTARGPPPTN
ncbi:MAG: hypothetical protein P4L66_08675 [Acetobacteraceae bacterium]|nr:hypothetical protein [Acetobacteraceae bacterium]